MPAKTLLQVSVATTAAAEEAVAELLARVAGEAVATYINEDTKLAVVSAYIDRARDWSAARAGALETGLREFAAVGLALGEGTVSTRPVPKEDWAESWKRHFQPIAIGTRLLIKPSWIKQPRRPGQSVVILDPGLSFGTGNHPTTAFCLETLVNCRVPGQHQACWDVGTGSGILAIAAAKLGYGPVRGFDFDREAVRVARANARRNRVLDRISLTFGDITKTARPRRPQYDIVCANLISNLLIAEHPRLLTRLKPTGTLVLAGILAREFDQVAAVFTAAGLRLTADRTEGEWRSGAFAWASAAPSTQSKSKVTQK